MDFTRMLLDASFTNGLPFGDDSKMIPCMPRRDVVLTGLIAFGAGVAVGVNWKKLGKEAAPLLEKLGIKMSDLADFLATVTEEQTKSKPSRSRPKKARATAKVASSAPAQRNGNGTHVTSAVTSQKRKSARAKPRVLDAASA